MTNKISLGHIKINLVVDKYGEGYKWAVIVNGVEVGMYCEYNLALIAKSNLLRTLTRKLNRAFE